MCGIVGIVRNDSAAINIDLLKKMRDLMFMRGPDDAGLYAAPGIGLGHRRLSIIDLTESGHQPMCNDDQTIWIVFNGEIYNFKELRSDLIKSGQRFRSTSDTEVLLRGYDEWGLEVLARRIIGMFAFAIWDSTSQELHLVRDHVGKKPLFYYHTGNQFIFSSDIKSIWIAVNGSLSIDHCALDEFLYRYYICQDRTIFCGVKKFPAAHFGTLSGNRLHIYRYWSPFYSEKSDCTMDLWLEGMDYYFRSAVRRRLVADVPVGAFLSGGVDSSAVCAIMAQESSENFTAYTVGFRDAPLYDERRYSRTVAKCLGIRHKELSVTEDIAAHISKIIWHYGEPFGDSSMLPTYLVARAAARHVKVVLTGDGGDESFCGYPRFLKAALDKKFLWLPGFFRNYLLPLIAHFLIARLPRSRNVARLDLFCKYLSGDRKAFATNTNCWSDDIRYRLYIDSILGRLRDCHPVESQQILLESLTGRTQVDRALEYNLRMALPSDYLTKIDVATMANSLEARSPFLDKELLSFAMTIPVDILMRDGELKYLLKRYAERLLPNDILYRPKMGFEIPVGDWFATIWAKPLKALLLSDKARSREWFRHEVVAKVLAEHISRRVDHSHRIWTLLVFEIWNRLFIDRSLSPGDPIFE